MGYIIFLISVMISAGIIKKNNLFDSLFALIQKIKSKRAIVMLVSFFGGILPIPGRVLVSAGILDTIAPEERIPRAKFGIIDYISTHHFYLWSPLEKTVVLPMAALGISYGTFIGYVWPLVIISIIYILFYIFYILKEEDIILNLDNKTFNYNHFWLGTMPLFFGIFLLIFGIPPWYVFPVITLWYIIYTRTSVKEALGYINIELVIVLTIVILVGGYVQNNIAPFEQLLGNNLSLFLASLVAIGLSFVMGSSGKYAGIVAILVSIYGIQYLVWFLVLEFAAYNLSPTHKCTHIGRMYFGTKYIDYTKTIFWWMLILIFYAIIVTFLI